MHPLGVWMQSHDWSTIWWVCKTHKQSLGVRMHGHDALLCPCKAAALQSSEVRHAYAYCLSRGMCLQGRCAAVALYLNQLALLPVMETEGLELDLLVEDPYSEAAGDAAPEVANIQAASLSVVHDTSLLSSAGGLGFEWLRHACSLLLGKVQFVIWGD